MDYIMINEGKLKIMLEAEDLAEWDIRIDELDYANPYAKAIFEEILAYAKENFGFDATGRKVLLQLYPSRDGGCELFITRLGELERSSKEADGICQRAYSFDKLSHLLSVCRRLLISGFKGESSAWFDNEGKWFLLIGTEGENSELQPIDEFTFISEFGDIESSKFISLYLHEYAFPICEGDATSTLGKI